MAFKFASSFVRSLFNSGSAAVPSISFAGDENTGIYSPGADQVGIATAGTARVVVDNAGLITGTGTSLGAWTSYTPTLSGTGWAIGNGTASGFYCQVGKIVYFRAKITFGSTSTYGGSPLNLSLPVSVTGSPVAGQNVAFFDTSASLRYLASMEYASATAIAPRSVNGSLALEAVTTTVPFTWATGDTIDYSGTYEAA